MRVLHIYKDYPPVLGGIEGYLGGLAERQACRGMEVTVLVTAPSGATHQQLEAGVRVVRAGRLATVASTPLSLPLWHQIRRLEADITHLHFPYPWAEIAHLLWGRSAHTVLTYHSDIVRQRFLGRLYRPFAHRLLARCDRILVSSPDYATSSPLLAPHARRSLTLPLGIDPSPFLAATPDPLPELGTSDAPVVLFVGRLRRYKGVDVLVHAMTEVPATLLVVGRGRQEASLRRLARSSPAASRIHFLGDVSAARLPGIYAAADVVALPSTQRSEAFGLVLLEAMATAKPVLSTELGTGTSFVNRNGETGLVVAPDDAPALAAGLRTLVADRELCRRMGEQGRRRVVQSFDLDRHVDAVVELYRKLAASSSRGAGRLG